MPDLIFFNILRACGGGYAVWQRYYKPLAERSEVGSEEQKFFRNIKND